MLVLRLKRLFDLPSTTLSVERRFIESASNPHTVRTTSSAVPRDEAVMLASY
jgi:hypothetical protein